MFTVFSTIGYWWQIPPVSEAAKTYVNIERAEPGINGVTVLLLKRAPRPLVSRDRYPDRCSHVLSSVLMLAAAARRARAHACAHPSSATSPSSTRSPTQQDGGDRRARCASLPLHPLLRAAQPTLLPRAPIPHVPAAKSPVCSPCSPSPAPPLIGTAATRTRAPRNGQQVRRPR